jgi:hypothetical protein
MVIPRWSASVANAEDGLRVAKAKTFSQTAYYSQLGNSCGDNVNGMAGHYNSELVFPSPRNYLLDHLPDGCQ